MIWSCDHCLNKYRSGNFLYNPYSRAYFCVLVSRWEFSVLCLYAVTVLTSVGWFWCLSVCLSVCLFGAVLKLGSGGCHCWVTLLLLSAFTHWQQVDQCCSVWFLNIWYCMYICVCVCVRVCVCQLDFYSQNVDTFNCEYCPVRALLLVFGAFSLLLCTAYVLV